MKEEYRYVLHNVELTKEEAETLCRAEDILKEAYQVVYNFNGEVDTDLTNKISIALDKLLECDARINAHMRSGRED